MSDATMTIERVGARGDGIAHHEGRVVFLPFTAPGDVVRASFRGDKPVLIELTAPGARQSPPCPHFGDCGGCSLQHVADAAYGDAKRDFVRDALAHRGLDASVVQSVQRIPPGTRRRARLAMASGTIGFHRRGSHRVVDMQTCFVLNLPLVAIVQALKRLRLTGFASLTLADTGVDVLLELSRAPGLAVVENLTAFADEYDIARLSWRTRDAPPTPLVQRRSVRVNFRGGTVELPPDCFLQATLESEQAMRDLVVAGIGDAGRVADLYCGVGTFSYALAQRAKVHAVDGNAAAVAALHRAEPAIATETRDLARRPLVADELNRFGAVVFDPPYVGAATQARELARSAVRRVIAVSCNPASFARDARILVDGGYRLSHLVPVDQFVWSADVELVAHFER